MMNENKVTLRAKVISNIQWKGQLSQDFIKERLYKRNFLFRLLYWKENFAAVNRK